MKQTMMYRLSNNICRICGWLWIRGLSTMP